MDIEIRRAKAEDVDEVVRLWVELMEFHAELDTRFAPCEDATESFRRFAEQLVEGEDSAVLGAWVGKEMVGYISIALQTPPPVLAFDRFAMIHDEVVSARYRRSGIGEALFDAAQDWCRTRGVRIVQLFAAACNPVALGFWKKMGFRPYLERLWYEIE